MGRLRDDNDVTLLFMIECSPREDSGDRSRRDCRQGSARAQRSPFSRSVVSRLRYARNVPECAGSSSRGRSSGARFGSRMTRTRGSSERAARSGPPEKAGDFESGRSLRESDPQRQDRSTPTKVRRGRRRRSGARMASMNHSGVAHSLDPGADIIRCGCTRTGRSSPALRAFPGRTRRGEACFRGQIGAPTAVIRGFSFPSAARKRRRAPE